MDDDIAHTESISVLGTIMLDDSFESMESLDTFASVAIAEEKFFPVFCQRLDFVIIYPLHIFQDQLLRSPVQWVQSILRGCIGRIFILLGKVGI